MKTHLKNAGLIALYHPIAYLVGDMLIAIPLLLCRAFFEETDSTLIDNTIQPILLTILPLAFLFFFFWRDAYENRRFSPWMTIGATIPFFIVQIIAVLNNNQGFLLVGGVGPLTEMIFPFTEEVGHYLLVQLGLQLLIYLPTYLLASYCGYRHYVKEIEKMTAKPKETE